MIGWCRERPTPAFCRRPDAARGFIEAAVRRQRSMIARSEVGNADKAAVLGELPKVRLL